MLEHITVPEEHVYTTVFFVDTVSAEDFKGGNTTGVRNRSSDWTVGIGRKRLDFWGDFSLRKSIYRAAAAGLNLQK